MLHNLTRGGQTNTHQLRMIRQVLGLALSIGSIVWTLLFCLKIYMSVPFHYYKSYGEYYWYGFWLDATPQEERDTKTVEYTTAEGKKEYRRLKALAQDPARRAHAQFIESLAYKTVFESLLGSLFVMGMVMWYWMHHGRKTKEPKLERGGEIVSLEILKASIKGESSDIHMGDLPLIKDSETRHILVSGTTGSGKTNCFKSFIPQIRKRGDKAIIVDMTGEYVDRYFNADTDCLLNPFDTRTQQWNPWQDTLSSVHYDSLSESLVPLHKGAMDQFWTMAARQLLSTALQELQGERDMMAIQKILLESSMKDFEKFFEGTKAMMYAQEKGERMTLSIRATLAQQIRGFEYLSSAANFSIRKWIEEGKGWLFLMTTPDQRETLKPLLTAWLNIACQGIMGQSIQLDRRCWIMIDELPALDYLPSLSTLLAEGRKYGACVMAGFQNIAQINQIYGRDRSQSLLDLFGTYIFFRSTEPSTVQWISKVLGERESTKIVENLSYGANTVRDGVNLSEQNQVRPLVMPTEIANLANLESFVKLSGPYPITRIQMPYQS